MSAGPGNLGDAVQSCLARAFDAGLDVGLELGRLLGDAEPPALPDMGLLRKLADGGGRRTGDLLRRGWIRIELTEAGRAALTAVDGALKGAA